MNTTLFSGDYLRVLLHGDIAELCLDRRNDSMNKLDKGLLADIDLAVDAVLAAHPRGVLVTSAKEGFLAGADIHALRDLVNTGYDELVSFCAYMNKVLTRLDDLPMPVVTAVNGYALGGGLEVALCADFRILAEVAQMGFPEVTLGVMPGAGGTVRTTRLAGNATALEWITGGKSCKASAALAAGMADAVVEVSALRATALDWLQRAIAGSIDWQSRREKRKGKVAGTLAAEKDIFAAARTKAQATARHHPAALAIVDLLEQCAPLGRDEALVAEAKSFSAIAQTNTAKALIGCFISNQKLKRINHARAEESRAIKRVAVLGAGIMGGGIAYTSAQKGIPALMKDISQPALDLGMKQAGKLVAKQVEAGRMKQEKAEAILASIRPTLTYDEFNDVDIVVEAVVENLRVKREVLAQVERNTRPGTVIASNTSSLSIADIAAPLARPQDVVGMHFFNPVHVMPLVEVVRAGTTSAAAAATAVAYAVAMGKTPLVVKDCPGFLVNRMLIAYFVGFMRLVRDGADVLQIDRVMEEWGWPMGPAYLIDVTGIDTVEKVMDSFAAAYPEVMAMPFRTAYQLLVAEKRFGQKTGAGFYRYENDPAGKPKRSVDAGLGALLAPIQQGGTRAFEDAEIVERMMLPMILEADRCLEEKVVESVIEVDAGMRLGTGFPAHHGGPLWHADVLGLAKILAQCEKYRALGGAYIAGNGLIRRAAENRRYYDEAR